MKKLSTALRTFFAIDPPDMIKNAISGIIQQMRQQYVRAPIHWIRPEHLHITLQFIGEIAMRDVPVLLEHARQELKLKKSLVIALNEIELFPSPYKPRVISIKVEPQALLNELAKSLSRAVQATGYPVETRPYRGHLTLGKLRESRHPITLEAQRHPPIPAFRANTIAFYQSEPSADGPHYHLLDRINLLP